MHSEITKRRLNILGRSITEIENLLSQGADINITTHMGDNALFFSDSETTQYLISKGINLNHTNKQNETALFHSKKSAINVLLENHFNINHLNNQQQNALFFVEDAESLQILLDSGININQIDSEGNNALMFLLPVLEENEEAGIIIDIFIKNGIDINQTNNQNQNLLFIGGYQYAEIFIRNGIDINHIDDNGNNILLYTLSQAFYSNNLNMCKLLLDHKIDFDQPNDDEEIALFYANTKDICKLLIQAGADTSNRKILFKHVANNNMDTTDYLITHGLDVNVTDFRGNKLIFVSPSLDMSKLLLSHSITLDEWDLRNADPETLQYINNKIPQSDIKP